MHFVVHRIGIVGIQADQVAQMPEAGFVHVQKVNGSILSGAYNAAVNPDADIGIQLHLDVTFPTRKEPVGGGAEEEVTKGDRWKTTRKQTAKGARKQQPP